MVRSLAWRIQIWHALTLTAVVVGLGLFVYFNIERATFRQVDTELQGSAQLLVAALRSLSTADFESGNFSPPPLLGMRRLVPPPDRPPPPRGHERRDPRPPGPRDEPFFIVWSSEGKILAQSRAAPRVPFDEVPPFFDASTALVRRRRETREAFLPGPHGSVVMVGRALRREMDELSRWRWLLCGAGGGALVFGVVGGAWLMRRALQPLAQISATAAAISADNLSARIDTQSIDIELARLAQTLNDAFGRLESDFHKQARFAADASHELRTPLTIILGQIEHALTQGEADTTTREALLACQRAARRMKSLIEQLLLLARADAGKLTPDRAPFDLGDIVEECVELLRPLAQEKQIDLIVAAKPVEISGDPNLLAQVAINLITNAIVHNHPGGNVRVTVTHDARQVQLSVSDSGPGIPASALPQLFQRFYRADEARSRATGGAGLGLAISQSIVRAHGGEITCQSQLGAGSEFVVRLPISAAAT